MFSHKFFNDFYKGNEKVFYLICEDNHGKYLIYCDLSEYYSNLFHYLTHKIELKLFKILYLKFAINIYIHDWISS
jgi:hypothetical protein